MFQSHKEKLINRLNAKTTNLIISIDLGVNIEFLFVFHKDMHMSSTRHLLFFATHLWDQNVIFLPGPGQDDVVKLDCTQYMAVSRL